MLTTEVLAELKSKLPKHGINEVIEAYNVRYNKIIHRSTVSRFFKGETYSIKVHNATLDVISAQQELQTKTDALING